MNKLLLLFATAILILPGSAWSTQSATQGQQSSDAAANTSPGQGAKPAPKKTDAQLDTGTETPQDSLAAAAHRAKEQKKAAPKSAKVFTNDDIPSSGGSATTEAKSAASETPAAAAEKTAANDEKSWRNKFAALRQKLDQDQAALDVMQRELGQLNVQYYSDPVKAMQQQYTRSDINDKTAQIEAKKKDIAADQQAISDAEDDLRKAGGEPGWAR
jgi:chromosome segregation ATPase